MGLDSYLYKTKKNKSVQEQILQELEERDNLIQLAYWRKEWDIVEAFAYAIGQTIENCEDYEVTKEELEKVYIITKDEQIKKVIDELDFNEYKLIFHSWW